MCTGDGEELIRLTTRFGKVDLGRGIRRAVTEARVRVASRAPGKRPSASALRVYSRAASQSPLPLALVFASTYLVVSLPLPYCQGFICHPITSVLRDSNKWADAR